MSWYLNNTLLVLLFVAQHSLGTTAVAKRLVTHLVGGRSYLWNFVYSLTTVIVIVFMAMQWKSTDVVIWSVEAPWSYAFWAFQSVCLFTFFFLFRFTQPFGEWLGYSQVYRMMKRMPEPKGEGYEIKQFGIKRYVRFPHHTVLMCMAWALPTMTTDLLLLALQATIYLYLGSAHQDMRGRSYFPQQWTEYRKTSRMLFPAVENVWSDVQDALAARWSRDASGAPRTVSDEMQTENAR